MSDRVPIAVGVSGRGSNLRALLRAEARGWTGTRTVLVFADRACPALDAASAAGIQTALIDPADHPDAVAWDAALAARLQGSGATLVVLAGFMRILGPAVLAAFPGRILNVHPALLPAFPGGHAVRDALEAGARVTGVTVHLVDATLDGGPIVAQEAVSILPGDDEAGLTERLHAAEHRLLPRCVALAAAGALAVRDRRVVVDEHAAASLPGPRRALLSVSDKRGLAELARGLDALGFELVSTGGTARALREAGLEVTDVAALTGVPEMLDGRVKTLHPSIAGGVLADLRRPDHRAQLVRAAIEPFELVVVNLYPFAEAAARPGVTLDELVEEIDIGGPTLVRAAAKNHASVGIVTDPDAYGAVLDELRVAGRLGDATRQALAVAAFRHTAAYDARIAGELPGRFARATAPEGLAPQGLAPEGVAPEGVAREGAAPGGAASEGVAPEDGLLAAHLDLHLVRVQRLRYGENPHQAAALYREIDGPPEAGPFARGLDVRQGKELSYNNLLDAAAAAAAVRDLRDPACVVVKHTNPCGAAEADDVVTAWERALAGDPVSAFGGVVAVTRPIDGPLAERLTSLFLEVVIAPGVTPEAAVVLARRPNLRVVVDPSLAGGPGSPFLEYRSAGGALLATQADVLPDDPAAWRVATTRSPDTRERADLDLAWRIVRHVKSNAIVLVRDGALVGVGAGQMSRVDSARLAVGKAGADRARGAVCASDAFYPFPDGVQVCLDAGVGAFVQPGGSFRDAEVIAAAEASGAAMVLTGVRHFRH